MTTRHSLKSTTLRRATPVAHTRSLLVRAAVPLIGATAVLAQVVLWVPPARAVGCSSNPSNNCPADLGSFVKNVIQHICDLGVSPDLPVNPTCHFDDCCAEPETDLFAGAQLIPPPPIGGPPLWCGFGGSGELMGDAALCLLRDLAQNARAPSKGGPGITLISPDIPTPVGAINLKQHVGFLHFDPDPPTMQGYQAVSVCVPVLGCIGDETQQFEVSLVHNSPDSHAHCGDYTLGDGYALHIKSDDVTHDVGAGLKIEINTPVGPVTVEPTFEYGTALKSVVSPFFDGNHQKSQQTPDACAVADMFDLYGLQDGLNKTVNLGDGEGWDNQLALGGRAPDNPWPVPSVDSFPDRPDFDFGVARNQDELEPVGHFNFTATVKYGADAAILAPLRTPPLTLQEADIHITPALDANFSSQFQLYLDEASFQTVNGECHPISYASRVSLQSATDAVATFKLTAGIHLLFNLDLGVWSKDFSFDPTVTGVDEKTGHHVSKGPLAQAYSLDGPPAHYANGADGAAFSFETFSGGPVSGDDFVHECLFSPEQPADQLLPTPSYTGGDPIALFANLEFPCNICINIGEISSTCVPKPGVDPTYDSTGKVTYDCGTAINDMPCTDPNCEMRSVDPPMEVNKFQVVLPASQAESSWLCDAYEKTGCFDMCNFDGQVLTVATSAVDLDGLGSRCKFGTGGGGTGTEGKACSGSDDLACDDGNPCTKDLCAGSTAEFGTCESTPINGLHCDDQLACNGTDTCILGICGQHTGNPCTAPGSECCNEATDTCQESCAPHLIQCGNGVVESGEQCDGADDTACPGLCLPPGDPKGCTCGDGCGNGVVEPSLGETCDPPGSVVGPCGQLCRSECTFCGDTMIQSGNGEQCDDGNCGECDPVHPQKALDGCSNTCQGIMSCKDPARITLTTGLDVLQFHGRMVPIEGGTMDFASNEVSFSLTTAQDLIFEASLPAGAIKALTSSGNFTYRNRAAKQDGGIYKLRAILMNDGSYRVTVTAYGDLTGAAADMVTHATIGGQEWTVHGLWSRTGSGWAFDGRHLIR